MEEKVTLKAFFVGKLGTDPRVREHHFDSIRLFMLGLGLKDKDLPSRYEAGLKVYFGEK